MTLLAQSKNAASSGAVSVRCISRSSGGAKRALASMAYKVAMRSIASFATGDFLPSQTSVVGQYQERDWTYRMSFPFGC
jgi:hypothetical protein